jgi:lipopolysaccharide biosynthesis protein
MKTSIIDKAKSSLFLCIRQIFRLVPMATATRDRLRQHFVDNYPNLIPRGPRGRLGYGIERRAHDHANHRAIGYVEHRPDELPDALPATLVAFYLPQFHPIPENDKWWGEGFTEWRNVARALPQFEGHAQPRLPGSLGFYDLRTKDVMRQQMQLAREYGISAFCTYFYWFAGRTLLEQPLLQWRDDPTLSFPICLCWANENWSRRWDGRADDVLIKQDHSAADDLAFIEHVATYLVDPRYLRVGGKPLLVVYRPGLISNAKATADRWREWCRAHDIGEIHLAYVQSFDNVDPGTIGFDAAIAFPPNNITSEPVTANIRLLNSEYQGTVMDWRAMARVAQAASDPAYVLYPGVTPSWDNEPRRSGCGRTFVHSSPRGYTEWLREAIETARRRTPQHPLVFVNAWNEWAEGAVLEPDQRLGHAWLEATRTALKPAVVTPQRPCAVIHVWYVDLLEEIVTMLARSGMKWRVIITTTEEKATDVDEELKRLGVEASVFVGENRGRDILPFIRVADRLLNEGEDIVLKLHTKRSPHLAEGGRWRQELLERLASPHRAGDIFERFRVDPQLGIVAPEGHVHPLHYFWGNNADHVEYLCRLIGLPEPEAESDIFVAGSMFWVRLSSLGDLLDAQLDEWQFEAESGQLDGTMAHAVERVFALTVTAKGSRIETAASIIGAPNDDNRPYPYARRGRT